MRRFLRDAAGAAKVMTAVVVAIAVAQYVLAEVVGSAAVFGLGPVTVKVLGITSGILTLLANALPSIFGEPANTTAGG